MRVLLIEDDPGIARFVRRGLAQSGYEVACEREGTRAEALLREQEHAALILDRSLPDGDGLDLCRRLRAAAMDLPVVMLTARGSLQDRLDGFAGGADDYLPKPFAFEELLARLRAVIRRRAAQPPRPEAHAGLVLDPLHRTARAGGHPLALSPREFALLLELVRARGAVVPRDRLIGAVWGEETGISDNALDVYVGYLRRRLGASDGAPAIETRRGQGFRLAPPP